MPPVGSRKTLVEGFVVEWKGSWSAPAVEVAPVSLIEEGIEPSDMPLSESAKLCLDVSNTIYFVVSIVTTQV